MVSQHVHSFIIMYQIKDTMNNPHKTRHPLPLSHTHTHTQAVSALTPALQAAPPNLVLDLHVRALLQFANLFFLS